MLRIIAGRLKGRKIPVINDSSYRPSTSKLKEAMFSILSTQAFNEQKILIHQAQVLDLFCGTGNISFEALSRGARHVTLVDINGKHLQLIKNYADRINELDNLTLLRLDATNLPKAYQQYNIVFLDPPFYKDLASKSLLSLHKRLWLSNNAIIFIESEQDCNLVLPAGFKLQGVQYYGKSKLTILLYSDDYEG